MLALKFFTVLKYFLSFRIVEQLAITLKNRVCPENFHCIEYTFTFGSFEQLALALKNSVPTIHCIEYIYIFLSFRIFEQLVLDLKRRVALKIFTALKYLLSFKIFEKLAIALKTEFSLNSLY